MQQLAASIREFGFNVPVLVDDAGVLIAGHGRVLAAKALGLASIPAIRLGHIGNYTYTLEDMLRERIEPQPIAVHREGTHWSARGLSSPEEAAKAKELRERALTRA